MHVRNVGYTLHPTIGAQNHLFQQLPNLTANSAAYIFGTKHNRASALETTKVVLHRLKVL